MKKSFKTRIAALLTVALVLTMLPMTVFADITDPAAAGNTNTISGAGTTVYVSTNQYRVVVPTSEALDFTLDPQGLLSMADGDQVTLDTLSGNAGKVVTKENATAFITNRSSYPVKVNVKFKGTGDATFVDSKDALNNNTTTNVLLAIIPSSAKTVLSENEYSAASKGFLIKSADVSANFLLNEAKYTVSRNGATYSYNYNPGEDDGTGLRIGGYVNTRADWSDFIKDEDPSTVEVSTVFTFSKAADTDVRAAEAIGYGLMATDADTVDVDVDVVAGDGSADINVNRYSNAVFTFGSSIGTISNVKWTYFGSTGTQKGTGDCMASDWTLSADGKTFTMNANGESNLLKNPTSGEKIVINITATTNKTVSFTFN